MPRTARQLRIVVITLEALDPFLWGCEVKGTYSTRGMPKPRKYIFSERDQWLTDPVTETAPLRTIVDRHLSNLRSNNGHSILNYPYFLNKQLLAVRTRGDRDYQFKIA